MARGDWRYKSISRVGVSSIFSVLGNIIFPFSFVATVMAIRIKKPALKRLGYTTISCINVIIYSLLTGGREGLLILAIIYCFFFIELYFENKKQKAMILYLFLVFMTSFIAVGSSFFYFRAKASEMQPDRYVSFLINRLGGKTVHPVCTPFSSDLACATKSSLLASATYFVHSRWMFDLAIATKSSKEITQGASFSGLRLFLRKAKIAPQYSPYWDLNGLFLSAAGALYFDFGLIGVILFSGLLGLAIFAADKLTECKNGAADLLSSLIYSVILSTPTVFLINFIPFIYTTAISFMFVVIYLTIKNYPFSKRQIQ
ncbi:MAG: hypothetical protein R3B45_14195 [Bdellovibrionota bacterium]